MNILENAEIKKKIRNKKDKKTRKQENRKQKKLNQLF